MNTSLKINFNLPENNPYATMPELSNRELQLIQMQREIAIPFPERKFVSMLNPISKEEKKRQRKFTEDEIIQRIDKETLFLLAYVPFVIGEVAWDYADSCMDMAKLLRLHETKRLCRRIRELRNGYDRIRYQHIDSAHRQSEEDNMILFQENYKDFFNKLHINIKGQVSIEHPGLNSESHLLITAAYSCAVVLRSLFKYMDTMEKRVADLLGIEAIGTLVINEIRGLEKIILQFAGEDSIGNNNQFPDFLNPFINTLCNYLLQSEMVELPCPVD